jgi:CubicO group peptidase (beta-lactamase class C family)
MAQFNALAAAGPELVPIAPGEAGFAPDLAANLNKAVAERRVWNLRGVIIVRNGRLVLERYFEGADYARGRPLGKVAVSPETLHDLRSVSKRIVGLLYGIALERGKVPPPARCSPRLPNMPTWPPTAAAVGSPSRMC